jgi:glycosyltransferase involved in cell wall biosynthesis
MASPFFTIIIPTFNSGKTLQNALSSILFQSFSDFEILIIDGISNDNTIKIVKENAEKDKRIRFISEKDDGIFDAMNKGIELSFGEWLYFLGSDDQLHDSSVLNSVFDNVQNTRFNFFYGNILSSKGIYDGEFDSEKILKKNISHQAIFYRKNIFNQIGNYNTRYKTHADWDFNIRCFSSDFISVKYLNIIIADFAKGGVSSRHEILFFREKLIPAKLSRLNNSGTKQLRKISLYDEWWRFLRNSKMRNQQEFDSYSADQSTPTCIKNMIQFQKKISSRILQIGFFSKSFMLISYLYNRMIKSF